MCAFMTSLPIIFCSFFIEDTLLCFTMFDGLQIMQCESRVRYLYCDVTVRKASINSGHFQHLSRLK